MARALNVFRLLWKYPDLLKAAHELDAIEHGLEVAKAEAAKAKPKSAVAATATTATAPPGAKPGSTSTTLTIAVLEEKLPAARKAFDEALDKVKGLKDAQRKKVWAKFSAVLKELRTLSKEEVAALIKDVKGGKGLAFNDLLRLGVEDLRNPELRDAIFNALLAALGEGKEGKRIAAVVRNLIKPEELVEFLASERQAGRWPTVSRTKAWLIEELGKPGVQARLEARLPEVTAAMPNWKEFFEAKVVQGARAPGVTAEALKEGMDLRQFIDLIGGLFSKETWPVEFRGTKFNVGLYYRLEGTEAKAGTAVTKILEQHGLGDMRDAWGILEVPGPNGPTLYLSFSNVVEWLGSVPPELLPSHALGKLPTGREVFVAKPRPGTATETRALSALERAKQQGSALEGAELLERILKRLPPGSQMGNLAQRALEGRPHAPLVSGELHGTKPTVRFSPLNTPDCDRFSRILNKVIRRKP